MSQEPILRVRQLTTRLQIDKETFPVVQNLSFDLHKGKTLAIVGESGCGKSITALSIMRIIPQPPMLPSTGEVIYNGVNLLTASEKEMRKIRGSKIAMIFQDPISSLNPVYRIGDQLMEVAELHLGLYGEEAFERSVKVLQEVGVAAPRDRMYDYPHQLSGGMKQRVMIAMALMCEPDILIADEPTTALDVTIQAQVLDLIRNLQERNHMALLLITHDMGVVAEMADEVIVMYAAQNVERAPVREIFQKMAHPYTMGLFNSRPTLTIGRGKLQAIKGAVPSVANFPSGCRFHPRCPYVMEKCCQGDVPQFAILGNEEHQAKCWLWDRSEESFKKFEVKNEANTTRS